MKNPNSVIKFDKISGKLERPTLLLKTRTGETIDEIPNHSNLKLSFTGKGLDEISFDVHKITNGKTWDNWDKLIDLCIIEYVGYGQFEADVSILDELETVKTVCCVSLETELGQHIIREGHFNDELDIKKENYKPTVLYNQNDLEHSLLYRVIKDKAPHWSIGKVSTLFNINGKIQRADSLQRTFTIDGTSIYDFLENEVCEEFCCVFLYDTYSREINCFNLQDCVYDNRTFEELKGYSFVNGVYYNSTYQAISKDDEIYPYLSYCEGVGVDTNIYLSKEKLSQSFSVDSDKDSIKNCFYITGGDDVINKYIGAANVTGNNYIYLFANFQYEDMGKELSQKLKDYSSELKEANEKFVGEDGLFTRYTKKLDEIYYLEHSKFPNVSISNTTATEQMNNIVEYFKNNDVIIQLSCTDKSFTHVTNTIKSIIDVVCDVRYEVEILSNSEYPLTCTTIEKNNSTGTWKGYLKITREIDSTDSITSTTPLSVTVKLINNPEDSLEYCEQKMDIALNSLEVSDLDITDYNFQDLTKEEYNVKDSKLRVKLSQYNVTSLKSFYEGFEVCMSTLSDLYGKLELEEATLSSDSAKIVRANYVVMRDIAKAVYENALSELEILKTDLTTIDSEIIKERAKYNLETYLGEKLYKQFRSYVREDEYSNSNYISDGLTDSEILEECKQLIDVATRELSNACNIQTIVAGDINDIFALDELSELHSKFALFNYVWVEADNVVYKLRLLDVGFSDESPEKLDVTFSDQVVSLDGTATDIKNILSTAQSIATTYNSTTKQAQQGNQAYNIFDTMQKEGFDSTMYLIKSSDAEDITFGRNGLSCRTILDEGVYSDNACSLNTNTLAFTTDNWVTPRTALGRFKYNDKWVYGLNAEVILGNLIVGEECEITGKITVGGDLQIGGQIRSENYEVGKAGSMLDLLEGEFDFAGGNLTYDLENGLRISGTINIGYMEQDMFNQPSYNFSIDKFGDLYSRSKDSELSISKGKIQVLCDTETSAGYYMGFGNENINTSYGHVSICVQEIDSKLYNAIGFNPDGSFAYNPMSYHIGIDGVWGNKGGAYYKLTVYDCECQANGYSFSDIYKRVSDIEDLIQEISEQITQG